MNNPKYIKSVFGKRVLYQAIFKRNHLVIHFASPDIKALKYRIFFNNNVILEKDLNGIWFKQFHPTIVSAKKELSRYAKFKQAYPAKYFKKHYYKTIATQIY